MYCVKREALDDSKAKFLSKEQYTVSKIFVGKSDLTILELKKKVKNEKFKSLGKNGQVLGKNLVFSWRKLKNCRCERSVFQFVGRFS
mgnify:CR=1 FL=1